TAEILRVISSSLTDAQPVFDAIVHSGRKLFPDATIAIALPDGEQVRAVAIAELDPQRVAAWKDRFPNPLSRDYMHGTAILDRRVIDIPDAEAYGVGPLALGVNNFLKSRYRAITIMPMVRVTPRSAPSASFGSPPDRYHQSRSICCARSPTKL